MEHDIELKRKKIYSASLFDDASCETTSKFFNQAGNHSSESHSRSSSLTDLSTKENINHSENFIDVDDVDTDPVEQEKGYRSPSPCFSRNLTPDLSSPIAPVRRRNQVLSTGVNNYAYSPRKLNQDQSPSATRQQECTPNEASGALDGRERILVKGSSEPPECEELNCDNNNLNDIPGPDLRLNFGLDDEPIEGDEALSVYSISQPDCDDKTQYVPSPGSSATPPMATQPTSRTDSRASLADDENDIEEVFGEALDDRVQAAACAKVAKGWASRFAFVKAPTRNNGKVLLRSQAPHI